MYGSSVVRITTPLMPSSATGKSKPSRISGSGFMATKDGYIITSLAVVQGRGLEMPLRVRVEFARPSGQYGRTMGWVVGAWEGDGTAVIKVDPAKVKVAPLPLGNSDSIAGGQRVVALGVQPNMVVQQATGVITQTVKEEDGASGNDHVLAVADSLRYPSGVWSEPLAGVGGPLFDSAGKVIAIVGPPGHGDGALWGYSGDITRQAIGIYWAASSVAIAGQTGAPQFGHVFVGLACDWLGPGKARKLGQHPGAMVTDVIVGSPADKAGIKGPDSIASVNGPNGPRFYMVGGDVVLSVEGRRLTRVSDWGSILQEHKVGDVIRISLWRDGRPMTVSVRVGPVPK
jgi:S1-C subfamily serine protease